jgi:hypothetical protein
MRLALTISMLIYSFLAIGQKVIDKRGYAHFFSEAPLENIEGTNENALGALDLTSGNVAVTMNMSQFEFAKSLMKEHFNENYIESDKFPKATFVGTLSEYEKSKITTMTDSLTLDVMGQLTIHGVTRPLSASVGFKNDKGILMVETKFVVEVASFDIDIPTVVVMNIAEQVDVTARFKFENVLE